MTEDTSSESQNYLSVALRLKELRRDSRVSQADMATHVQRTQSWISLLERGNIPITSQIIDAWCDATTATSELRLELLHALEQENKGFTTWCSFWESGAANAQAQVGDLEANATRIRVFHPTMIYGLLQTVEYIKAVYFALDTFVDERDLDSFVKARLARQSLLLQNPSLHIEVLLTEAAFRMSFLDPSDTAKQIRHIIRLAKGGFFDCGVIPFSTRLAVIPYSGWEFYDDKMVVVELTTGRVTFMEEPELEVIERAHAALWDSALRNDDAMQFLKSLAAEYESS